MRRARRHAALKLSVAIHTVPFIGLFLLLVIATGLRVALIVAFAWGILLALHAFLALVAPSLRRHWIALELSHWRQAPVRNREPEDDEERIDDLLRRVGGDPRDPSHVEAAERALAEFREIEAQI